MPVVNTLVQVRQGLSFRFLGGLQDGDIGEGETLKASVLAQFTPFREGVGCFIS